ncbi:ABC transporter ATP-binding protein [Bacillus chungangensis]|uniref:Iron complex transport system ATP-binding protein n=1 Tax=Bacillus chungangensis TaxID=587633 RepID=A0ABT9WN49_9BACI|nr:ABC transporter ATP-binding protein [Bacillus chungangensis]MDQ0174620.1 iron complex transport system ATP-binding protein [Bacillus chungangensis]
MTEILEANNVRIGYGDKIIVNDLKLSIPRGKITSIIGPNGCGKSTFLKALSRILKPISGYVYLDGKSIHKESTKETAKRLAILPQSPDSPAGLTVHELISYGRFPHQKGFGRLTKEDYDMIDWALEVTGLTLFRHQAVDALSGGQRQRVWIAMALAQGTEILLLDEPTTYLDMAHQLEILTLLQDLNKREKKTIVMVIHDLNHAARFSHYIAAMHAGNLIYEGDPQSVITSHVLKDVFHIDARIIPDPELGCPVCLSYNLLKQPIEKVV